MYHWPAPLSIFIVSIFLSSSFCEIGAAPISIVFGTNIGATQQTRIFSLLSPYDVLLISSNANISSGSFLISFGNSSWSQKAIQESELKNLGPEGFIGIKIICCLLFSHLLITIIHTLFVVSLYFSSRMGTSG